MLPSDREYKLTGPFKVQDVEMKREIHELTGYPQSFPENILPCLDVNKYKYMRDTRYVRSGKNEKAWTEKLPNIVIFVTREIFHQQVV